MTAAWCIIRTAPSRTLGLAKALTDAGFDVWTPVEEQTRRAGRERKRTECKAPLTPSFLFAAYDRLGDLVELARSPSQTWQVWDAELARMVAKGIPYFSVFRCNGKYPRVSDAALDPLRLMEQRRKPKTKARQFVIGQAVRFPDAGFDGLPGTVLGMQGRHVLVSFLGLPITVRIPAEHLLPYALAA